MKVFITLGTLLISLFLSGLAQTKTLRFAEIEDFTVPLIPQCATEVLVKFLMEPVVYCFDKSFITDAITMVLETCSLDDYFASLEQLSVVCHDAKNDANSGSQFSSIGLTSDIHSAFTNKQELLRRDVSRVPTFTSISASRAPSLDLAESPSPSLLLAIPANDTAGLPRHNAVSPPKQLAIILSVLFGSSFTGLFAWYWFFFRPSRVKDTRRRHSMRLAEFPESEYEKESKDGKASVNGRSRSGSPAVAGSSNLNQIFDAPKGGVMKIAPDIPAAFVANLRFKAASYHDRVNAASAAARTTPFNEFTTPSINHTLPRDMFDVDEVDAIEDSPSSIVTSSEKRFKDNYSLPAQDLRDSTSSPATEEIPKYLNHTQTCIGPYFEPKKFHDVPETPKH